jgi:pilus assembly protein Flp/PilA
VNKINGGIMMKDMLMRLVREEDGQALTEYGLIIGLVAVVVIAGLILLGGNIQNLFNSIAERLGGIQVPNTLKLGEHIIISSVELTRFPPPPGGGNPRIQKPI